MAMFDRYPSVSSLLKCREPGNPKRIRLHRRSQSYSVYQQSLEKGLPVVGLYRTTLIEDTWNQTATLRSNNGAILDPDDKLDDVIDDREILTATLGPIIIQPDSGRQSSRGSALRGDGTSASSEGSPSPEPIQVGTHHTFQPFARQAIEVTGEERSDVPLHVRRGSEPSLHRLQLDTRGNIDLNDPKRWSAAVVVEDGGNNKNTSFEHSEDESFLEERRLGSGREDELSAFARFVRNSNRMSMQPYGALQWEDAADNAVAAQPIHFRSRSQGEVPRPGSMRREPVGSTCPPPEPCGSQAAARGRAETVVLANDNSALGIHVVPAYDQEGRDHGLSVQGVEPGGRVHRDGRIAAGDKIIEINGRSLQYVPFQRSQEIFRQAMQSHDLRLVVLKRSEPLTSRSVNRPSEERLVSEGNERMVGKENVTSGTSSLSKRSMEPGSSNILAVGNTRKIGRMHEIDLLKGPKGLGFSVTTRDNPAGGDCPIYVKKILPEGAAIEDGRLRAGDRLLEVNGISMSGKMQEEAVAILRSIPPKGIAHIVVSRHEAAEPSPTLPRKLGVSQESLTTPSGFRNREILTFDIPVHDTEKAGLGISVKGKTSTQSNGATIDLGIFIKSVIHGGAASKDGRLKSNDQLLSVNGTSLAGLTNSEAMTTLRKLVHSEGPIQGCITLTVARKTGDNSGRESTSSMLSNSSGQENCGKSDSGTTDNSGSSDSSGKTIIFVGTGPVSVINNNQDSNQNQLRVLPLRGASEERLEPPPRAPPNMNPMIDRIVGKQNARNESYYKATHDTWSSSQIYESSHRYEQKSRQQYTDRMYSTTRGENVLLQDDYVLRPNQNARTEPGNVQSESYPAVRGGFGSLSQANDAASSDRVSVRSDRPSDSETLPYESQKRPGVSSEAVRTWKTERGLCQLPARTSLDESAPGFTRDQPGRQSMSEKRHTTLDAKNTDTYQRQKKAKEERKQTDVQQQEPGGQELISPRGTWPRRGMKRPHNPLYARVAETEQYEPVGLPVTPHYQYEYAPVYPGRVSSFENIPSVTANHAVYSEIRKQKEVGPALGLKKSSSLESLQTMVHEIQMQGDENYPFRPPGSKVVRGRPSHESSRSTVYQSQDSQLGEPEEEDVGNAPTAALDLAENIYGRSQTDPKKGSKTKKSSILKGLGSMFRFGKHRKAGEGASGSPIPSEYIEHPAPAQDMSRHVLRRTLPHERSRATTEPPQGDDERLRARQLAEDEQRRIQEQCKRLMERSRGPPGLGDMIPPSSRQRAHPGQQGPPPYNHASRQEETYARTRQRPASSQEIVHGRSSSFDSTARGSNRYEVPVHPPNYVNVEENNQQIRTPLSPRQLKRLREQVQLQREKVEFESRRQQQYRSQRSHREVIREAKTERPTSNYFEYESIQNSAGTRQAVPNYPPRFQPDLPTIQQGGKPKPPYPPPPGPPQGFQPQPNPNVRKQDRSHTTGYGRDKRLPLQSSIFDPLGPPRPQTQHSHPRYQQNRQPPYPPPPPQGGRDYQQHDRQMQRPGAVVLSGSKV